MTERDWRIFREDNNISYKGVNTVQPIRSWDEAVVPSKVMRAIKVQWARFAAATLGAVAFLGGARLAARFLLQKPSHLVLDLARLQRGFPHAKFYG